MRERITLAHAGMGGVLVYRRGLGTLLFIQVTKNTVRRISLNILPRFIVPAREKVDFHGEEDIWYPQEIILNYTWLIVLSHNSII